MSKNAKKGRPKAGAKKIAVPPKPKNRFERAAAEVDRDTPRDAVVGVSVAAKAQNVLDHDEEIEDQQKEAEENVRKNRRNGQLDDIGEGGDSQSEEEEDSFVISRREEKSERA